MLVDAAGTLIYPSEPAAEVYLKYASQYGCLLSTTEILANYRRAYSTPWDRTPSRYVADGRDFWRFIVSETTLISDEACFEAIYNHYAAAEAWSVAPGAPAALASLRRAGVSTAVVSNFDTRLRPLLGLLGLEQLFDAIVVSAEVGVEKPNPVIFDAACERLGCRPIEAVHVGDDRRNDVFGARDAGCWAWLWGVDVRSFEEVARRVLQPDAAED
ncbi:hypothetical protein WJX81_006300 [Elliptochloris bilobata]|uniref:Haloacid dehalogenase-like hydrolase domain-containing protein 3 n=1 Tax=Elliptochloris bilobata TaxID=381761 RepID=A0AAW1RI47_9CHLO